MKYLSSGLLAACLSLVIGALFGAATQRWGDGVLASNHIPREN